MDFICKQAMMFISTADGDGNCDSSFRAGQAGFVKIIDERKLAYPEFRGNGIYASLGNILENPHIGLLFVDFFEFCVGLHVNGTASIVEGLDEFHDVQAERWVTIDIHEAYIHCSKHVPLLQKLDKTIHWGTDDTAKKGGDFFRVSTAKQV